VQRRVEVVATARDGSGVYGTFSAMGVDGSGLMCGDAEHGLDGTFTGNQCSGYNVYEEELSLPPVDPGPPGPTTRTAASSYWIGSSLPMRSPTTAPAR
jgi:hypothetical protein